MPRKSPTTGAKPHRDDHQSYVAEDIWYWIKEHQNMILLVLTILVAGTVIYVMRSRAAQQTQRRAQQALSQIMLNDEGSEEKAGEQIKRATSKVSKFENVDRLAPWFHLNLANVYYIHQRYDQAIQTLKELRETYPDSPASDFSEQFQKDIKREKAFVQNELQQKKKKLDQRFRRQKLVYGVQERELRSSDDSPPAEN